MSLKQTIQADLKSAMKEGLEQKVSVLRLLLAAVTNEEIAKNARELGLPDDTVFALVKREAKKRSDAAELYRRGGDEERASREESELVMLKMYLPPEVSEEQIASVVNEVITTHPGATQKEFGMLMKEAVAKLGSGADGRKVSEALKKCLVSSG